jgi:Flp pilus assembly protein TadD
MIMLRYVYDNSPANKQNPNSPPQRVTYGMRSADEMGDLFLQLLPRDAGETSALRRAVDWKQHTNEMVYLAHTGRAMGDSALARGDVDAAIALYREALSLTPNAETHFVLGKALVQKGDRAQATVHLRQALRLAEEDGNEELAAEVRKVLLVKGDAHLY